MEVENKFCKSLQLCWSCSKSLCGCSWSRDFTPIEGWDAVPVVHMSSGVKIESYCIRGCPEYAFDGSKITQDRDHTGDVYRIDDVSYDGKKLRALVKAETGMTLSQFGAVYKFGDSTLRRIGQPGCNPSKTTMSKLASALHRSVKELKEAIKSD